MAIQFRSIFPLALPGMLALLGWWWFFSRKKEHVNSHNKQVEASAVELRAGPAIEELAPVEDACRAVVSTSPSVTQPAQEELATVYKPSTEPPALLQSHPACRRSESSGSLSNTTDTRVRPGTCRDDSARVEPAQMGDEAKPVPLECALPSPKAIRLPHEATEMFRHETGWGQQGQSAAPTEKHGPGEKVREMGDEGTGDAVLGESGLEEGVLSLEHSSALQSITVPSMTPLGGGGEERKSSPPRVEGDTAGKLMSSFNELAPVEQAKDDETLVPRVQGGQAWDGKLSKEESLDKNEETSDKNEEIEQAAYHIVSKVILDAAEEVLATTMGKMAGCMYQASAGQLQGQKEERCAPVCQKTALRHDALEPTQAAMEAVKAVLNPLESALDPSKSALDPSDAAFPLPGLPAEDLPPPPKTYVSCLTSPLSSPTKDTKPKNSVHHIALTPCPPPATPLGESLDNASILVEDAGCVTCMSDNSQDVPSESSSGQCSDSVSTSGLGDSCTETNSSPRDKATTSPLPQSTVPFSNGMLKEELSDLGTEDGWTVDTEADHSGGRRVLGVPHSGRGLPLCSRKGCLSLCYFCVPIGMQKVRA